jgi:hypothetical protein
MTGRDTTERPFPRRVRDWLVTNPLPAVTIAGAVVYAIVRTALQRFYVTLGVEPEEVGLGYSDVLARTVFGLVIYLLIALGVAAVSWLLLAVLRGRMGIDDPLRGYTPPRSLEWWMNRTLRGFPVIMGCLSVILFVFLLFDAADVASNDVRSGRAVRPGYSGWEVFNNPLALRADLVKVEWLGEDKPRALMDTNTKVMYLGRSEGVIVLYDTTHQRTLRLPGANVSLTHGTH